MCVWVRGCVRACMRACVCDITKMAAGRPRGCSKGLHKLPFRAEVSPSFVIG